MPRRRFNQTSLNQGAALLASYPDDLANLVFR